MSSYLGPNPKVGLTEQCDEARPVCRDCHRHGVACVYDRSEGSSQAGPPAAQVVFIQPVEPVRGHSPAFRSNRDEHLELRLLHHFTVATTETIPWTHVPHIKERWTVDVPRLAFTYRPLLHVIFSISALHMAKSEPGQSHLLGIHREYFEEALREHRFSVQGITRDIADAACFTTVLLLIDVFATLQDRPLQPYEPPLEWMHLVRGSETVFRIALDTIRDNRSAKIWSIIESFPPVRNAVSNLNAEDLELFSYLVPDSGNEENGEKEINIYRETIAYITATRLAMESTASSQITARHIMVFPLLAPAEFMGLLEEKRPRALVMLAHLLAMAAPLSDRWWIGHTGHRDVFAIRDMLGEEWRGMMEWPVEVVSQRCWICRNDQPS